MKYGILLIGFEYTKSDRWKKLPGIPVDLYQVYRYTKNITKNILLFTDIDCDYDTSVLQRAILDGYVDSGLLSFIEDVKERKQYYQYTSSKKNGYTINNFEQTVSNFAKKLDRLFIYYTGHGKNGDIILPDDTHVPLIYIKKLLTDNVDTNCQIISILDCCESNGLNLPYQYVVCKDDTKNNINGNWKLYSQDFNSQQILCISSSQLDEETSATNSGSLFTRLLFGYLYSNYNNYILLKDLCANIMEIYIHGSYPNLKLFYGWFTKIEHNNIDITVDNNNSTIKIKLNNCQPTVDKSSSMTNYLRYHHNGRYESI